MATDERGKGAGPRQLRRFSSVSDLADALAGADGPDSYDEPISLLDHSLQTAELVQRIRPDDVELQVAALLHDVGFLQPTCSPQNHAALGARSVKHLFSARVARIISGHALAKVYLTSVDPTYVAVLSPRSMQTLALQAAGPRAQRLGSGDQPDRDACLIRRADDFAKQAGAAMTTLGYWVRRMQAVALSRSDVGRAS